jgi:hypothetical protein
MTVIFPLNDMLPAWIVFLGPLPTPPLAILSILGGVSSSALSRMVIPPLLPLSAGGEVEIYSSEPGQTRIGGEAGAVDVE